MSLFVCCIYVFFFKQKTAYEMRISDWSSDVCSSDLLVKCKAVSQFVITGLCQTNGGNHEFQRLSAGPFGVCCGVASSFPIGCSEGDGQGLDGTGDDPRVTGERLRLLREVPHGTEDRRGGKGCVSTGRSRGWWYN